MREIYLLSGLGADKRVYDFIDLSGFKINHVARIDPIDDESIESYANRLLPQISSERPTIIGVSFGGIIAVELGKLIETEQVILISSAKTKFDIPLSYRIVGRLGLKRIVPTRFLKTVNSVTFWLFGTKNKKEEALLSTIIKETDIKFLQWAMDKVARWNNTTLLRNLTHIHGTADRILPFKSADFKIADGGHFMIVNREQELNKLIRRILD